MRLSDRRDTAAGRLAPVLAASLLALFFAGTARGDYGDPSQDYYEGSYGYLRVIDGTATLFEAGGGDRAEAVVNQPVLIGDSLWTSPGSRVEVVLSDRNLLRLDGDTEIFFDALAGSPDGSDSGTILRLDRGNVQVVVPEDFLGADLPRIDLPNATVYLREAGTYRVTADYDWGVVVARQGSAEVLTQRGSVLVRRGEQAEVEGSEWVQASVRSAGRLDNLERWGDDLYQRARRAQVRHVDPSLRYSSTYLADHGEWIYVDSRPVWRPRVSVGWRPYYDGRWYPTPSGLTWISPEPWGWVTYHYGTWDYAPRYGWVWHPGRYYSPAWVYWHWTPNYAAWCPVGYYTRHYYPRYRRHFNFGFHFGVYGWAGGHVNAYAHWNFIKTPHLAYRNHARYVRPGNTLRAELGRNDVPRGIVTTDTRPITPQLLKRPQQVAAALETRPARSGGRLPDVTGFISKGDLGAEQIQAVAATRPRPGSADLTANPMVPQVRPEGGGAGARLQRRPAAVASGGSRGGSELSRRPAPAPDRGGASSAREPSRVAARPGSDSSGGLVRRPSATGNARPSGSSGTLERRPGARPDDSGRGVSIQRRPATRPEVDRGRGTLDRRPAATGSEDDRGAPSIQRRPTAGSSDSSRGSSIQRRPATGSDSGSSRGSSIQRRPTRPRPDPPGRSTARPGSTSRPAPSTSSRPSSSRPSPSASGSGSRSSRPRPSASSRPGSRDSRPETSRPSSGSRSPRFSPRPGSGSRSGSSPQVGTSSPSRSRSSARGPSRSSSSRPSLRSSSGSSSSRRPSAGSSGRSSSRRPSASTPSRPPSSGPSASSPSRSSGSRSAARSSSGSSGGSRSSARSSSRSSGGRSSARSSSGSSGGSRSSARRSGRSGGRSRGDDDGGN